MSLSSNVFDTALIFEGGAMRASYTAPVVNVLLKNDIYFDWTAGMCRFDKHGQLRVAGFEACPSLLHGLCWRSKLRELSNVPARRGTVQRELHLPADFRTGRSPSLQFQSVLLESGTPPHRWIHAETGETAYWGREDLITNADIMKKVQASSTMPGLMPVVDIRRGAMGRWSDGTCWEAWRSTPRKQTVSNDSLSS